MNKSSVIRGHGDVLSPEKEKIGDCELSIEIKELRSLLFSYKQSFNFSLDGKDYTDFESSSAAKASKFLHISQMFYDRENDSMSLCSLIYAQDLSYAVLRLDDKLYFINNGADITYDMLPV